ncbi:hypothetical protein BA768_01205 [Chryseobacterium sp. CBo1]|nr:hypothetical protein BA768_01205 [Chryseobacterium sp. CBo1]
MSQLTPKDVREIQAYLKTIQTYSALVEAKLSACTGGVGTAQRKQSKSQTDKEAAARARFHK